MRMRVDAAREDVLAARVDDAVRSYVQGFADQGDPLAFDVDVADVVVRRGDDAPAFDQNRHCGSPFSVACSYLPSGVTWTTAFFQLLPLTSKPFAERIAFAAVARSVR